MSTPRSEFISGVKALVPILLGVIPFGMISGIAVTQTHIPPISGFIMSLLVYSGAALLVALQLINAGAPALVVFLSALVINLRFMIYSASLAPYLKRLPGGLKALLAYLVTDQGYAASINHMSESPAPQIVWWHFLGSAVAMWLAWQSSVAIGMVLGAAAPGELVSGVHDPANVPGPGHVPASKTGSPRLAAVVAGVTAVLANGAPLQARADDRRIGRDRGWNAVRAEGSMTIWLIMIALAIGTFLVRISFIQLLEKPGCAPADHPSAALRAGRRAVGPGDPATADA